MLFGIGRFSRKTLDAAHKHCRHHLAELKSSEICGCFYCCGAFKPGEIEDWTDDDDTALCPRCGIDSVLGSASGYPVDDQQFLRKMCARWFS